MSSAEESNKPIHFRPTKSFNEQLRAYMGVHKIHNKTEALHRIMEDYTRLSKQAPVQTPEPVLKIPKTELAKNLALEEREKIKINALAERERIKTEELAKRRAMLGTNYRGPKIYGEAQAPRKCPKGWNASKCAYEPCDRRSQCRQEGII